MYYRNEIELIATRTRERVPEIESLQSPFGLLFGTGYLLNSAFTCGSIRNRIAYFTNSLSERALRRYFYTSVLFILRLARDFYSLLLLHVYVASFSQSLSQSGTSVIGFSNLSFDISLSS